MKRALALAAVVLTGCPPARVLPPSEMIATSAVDQALTAGEAGFSRRPDVAQVREALRSFQSAANADAVRVEGSIGVIRVVAWLVEHGAKDDRKALVEAGVAAAEQCQQRAPHSAPCDYWQAVALGLQAREQPLTALGMLPKIIELLRAADAKAPGLDDAGPARVLSLLLVRAPGWPAGPGNADDGVVAAQQAVARSPKYPLNELALGECLAATGDADGAKAAYQRAAALGRERGDADGLEWAAQALEKL